VTLLLHDVRLALPLPDDELAGFGAPHSQPITSGVEADGADGLISETEGEDVGEGGHLMQVERAICQTRHKYACLLVKRHGTDEAV